MAIIWKSKSNDCMFGTGTKVKKGRVQMDLQRIVESFINKASEGTLVQWLDQWRQQ